MSDSAPTIVYSYDFWKEVSAGKNTPVYMKYTRWLRAVRAAAEAIQQVGAPVTWWFLHLNGRHLINIPAPADGQPPDLDAVLQLLPELRSVKDGEFTFQVITMVADIPRPVRRGKRAIVNTINPQQQLPFMPRRKQ